jgi:hypothetical protein
MNPFISPHRKHLLLALTVLALALYACSVPGIQTGPSANSNDLLSKSSVGLDGLQSYHAVYDLTFKGTVDGKPYDRKSHIEYSFVTQSNDKEILWQEQQTGSEDIFVHSLRLGSAMYTPSQDGQDCLGEYNDQPAEIVPQPVSLLPPVTRSTKVGTETVNGVAAMHYHFDQNGLVSGEQGTSGEVWIAQQGGYVVKYILGIPGPTNPTGSGTEIAETLSYELTKINAIDKIELPAGCVPVLVDFPAMADAQDIYRSSGYMDYTSPSEAAQVIDFYHQALPALGWMLFGPPSTLAQTVTQILQYTQGAQALTIFLDKSAGSLEVTILLYNTAQAPQEPASTPGPSPTPGIQPTVDASQSGLPTDVPLYLGVTDLHTMPNGVRVSTSAPADTVATFYHDQLPSLGWSLLNELKPTPGNIDQTWTMTGRMLTIVIQSQNGKTTIIFMLTNQ